jgi:hypothetical protein
VDGFSSVTLAPATTAPEVSVTVPVMDAWSCACERVAKSASSATTDNLQMALGVMSFRIECLRVKSNRKSP